MTLVLYFSIELFSIIAVYSYQAHSLSKKKDYRIFLVWLVLFLLIAFRDESVGRDYQTYIEAMERVATNNERYYDFTWLSLGFRLLIKLIAFTGLKPFLVAHIVSAIIAAITIYFFLKAIISLSINPALSLLILFSFCYIFQSMNQFRQMMAVSIILYSYKYINCDIKKYILLVIFASLFHTSAIIMLPIFLLKKVKLNQITIMFYLCIAIAVPMLWIYIKKIISLTSYGYYVGWEQYDTSLTISTILNLIVRVHLIIICLSVRKRVLAENKKGYILYHMVILCTIFQIVSVYITMFSRLTTYFYEFYILLLPEVFKAIKSYFTKNSQIFIDIIIISALVVYQVVYFQAQSYDSGYNVYKFIYMIQGSKGNSF